MKTKKKGLKYAMDDGEFTKEFGIKTASITTFNETPHQTNKKAFKIEVEKDTSSGLSEYKSRFNFNLYKLIQDDLSDNYTVCIETYFQTSPFYSYKYRFRINNKSKFKLQVSLHHIKFISRWYFTKNRKTFACKLQEQL